MNLKTTMLAGLVTSTLLAQSAVAQSARDHINVVGSSTVYPFSTVVAERFGKGTKFKTPKIESTGSGGGLKLFCAGIGNTCRSKRPFAIRRRYLRQHAGRCGP